MAKSPKTERDRLERAAARLPPVALQVLLLSACDGLRNDEIAARLDISVEDAERHLADALEQLTCYLERQERRWWKPW